MFNDTYTFKQSNFQYQSIKGIAKLKFFNSFYYSKVKFKLNSQCCRNLKNS